jgi:hypothetical protein
VSTIKRRTSRGNNAIELLETRRTLADTGGYPTMQ